MYKPGDIVNVYANPLACTGHSEQARLNRKVSESKELELWMVEYLNEEGRLYETFIKKQNENDSPDTRKEE